MWTAGETIWDAQEVYIELSRCASHAFAGKAHWRSLFSVSVRTRCGQLGGVPCRGLPSDYQTCLAMVHVAYLASSIDPINTTGAPFCDVICMKWCYTKRSRCHSTATPMEEVCGLQGRLFGMHQENFVYIQYVQSSL